MSRPPLPPFTRESAIEKVRLAEDGWNGRNPAKVALAYTPDTVWRNRAEFPRGRAEVEAFLTRKWNHELEYRLIKELWLSPAIALPCAMPTSTTTTAASGFVPMATKTGSLPKMG